MLYSYDELNSDAAENVRAWYYDEIMPREFESWVDCDLRNKFPDGYMEALVDFDVENVSITGTLDLFDGAWYLEHIGKLTTAEADALDGYIYCLPDSRYFLHGASRCESNDLKYMHYFADYFTEVVSDERGVDAKELIYKFLKELFNALEELELDWTDKLESEYGSDREMEEYVCSNGILFTADGEVYRG